MRGKIRSIFTGAEINNDSGTILHSHPGASYGGFVVKNGADFEDFNKLVQALADYAKAQGFKAIRLTQTPLFYHRIQNQGLEFALNYHGFKAERVELTQSTDLKSLQDDVIDSLVDKTRNSCRRAAKLGVEYQEAVELNIENLSDFYRILVKNRTELGVEPTHTFNELIKLSQLVPDKLHLSFASCDGERIAGLLNFICSDRVVLLFYVAHLRDRQNLKPAPFLLANNLKWAKSAGFCEFDFGISTDKGIPNTGLLKFKENFRAMPFLRITYIKIL